MRDERLALGLTGNPFLGRSLRLRLSEWCPEDIRVYEKNLCNLIIRRLGRAEGAGEEVFAPAPEAVAVTLPQVRG